MNWGGRDSRHSFRVFSPPPSILPSLSTQWPGALPGTPHPGDSQDWPDTLVTGSGVYSQVTVRVHGQEVLSEETVPPGAEPRSPRELPEPPQMAAEESLECAARSPTLSPEEQSLDQAPEPQPTQESGGDPAQKWGFSVSGLGYSSRALSRALGSGEATGPFSNFCCHAQVLLLVGIRDQSLTSAFSSRGSCTPRPRPSRGEHRKPGNGRAAYCSLPGASQFPHLKRSQ